MHETPPRRLRGWREALQSVWLPNADQTVAFLVILAGLLLSLSAFVAIRGELNEHQRMEFEWVAHNRNNALKKGIENGLDAVNSVANLFDVSERVSSDSFRRYASALFERYPGIHTLEWVPRAMTVGSAGHPAQVQPGGAGDRLITQSAADRTPMPAAAGEVRFPIKHIYPARTGEQSVGFDYGSSPTYLDLIERAWLSGRAVVSGRVKLLKEDDPQYGFQVFQPVYRHGTPIATAEQRRLALRGFAVGVFRIADLANASISILEPRGVEFLIRDESAPASEGFLDFYASRLSPHTPSAADRQATPDWDLEDAPRVTETFAVADRRWSITCSATRQFRSAEGFRYGDWIVLIGGLMLTILMALFIMHNRAAMRVRLRIEQELRESEQKLRVLFHQSPDIIMTVDPEGRILMSNRSPTGDDDGPTTGGCSAEGLPERVRGRYHQALRQVFDTGDAGEIGLARDDASCWDLRIVPLRVGGRVTAAMVIITDVTEKRMLEIHAIRSARLASLGVLAASVAHEINNPNNAIAFNASILLRSWGDLLRVLTRFREEYGDYTIGGVPAEQAIDGIPRLLAGIENGSRRIHGIVGNLKHMARPDEGELDHRVDVADVLQNSLSLLQSQVRKYCDDCLLDVQEPLPAVQGNAQQLEQVFINLILNALQSLPNRAAKVRISAALEEEAEFIRVTVRDEGCGIPDAIRGRVLESFFTTKTANGGTGLGLSISYRIIQNHGGRMEFNSDAGEGTEVVVRLPRSART